MISRLHIDCPLAFQKAFWFGKEYTPKYNEFLVNHARTGIVMALQAALPKGAVVGVMAYNCHTVANAVLQSGCKPIFVDVTEDLHIDIRQLTTISLDAIIVTNLFGIHNDITQIRQVHPNAIIIVDNAHGYGLPVDGDFTVYSICQGKFPSLGEGGILLVNNLLYQSTIEAQYATLKSYTKKQELWMYIKMLLKALLHLPFIYTLTMRGKNRRSQKSGHSIIELRKMDKGVSRIYQYYATSGIDEISTQRCNAIHIREVLLSNELAQDIWWGANAFMVVARTCDKNVLQKWMIEKGVETATHFSRTIDWAQEFGYQLGNCPVAEQLTKELIMIPTYTKISL